MTDPSLVPCLKDIQSIEVSLSWAPDCGKLEDDLQSKLDEFLDSGRQDGTKCVYACYGLAMYHAQCLEVGLRSVLIGYARLSGKVDVASVDTYADSFSKNTLGQLLSRVREVARFNSESEDVLRNALIERNRLAHHYFEERVEELLGPIGHEKMVRELLCAAQLFRYADFVVAPLTSVLLRAAGVSEELLAEKYGNLLSIAQEKYGILD